MKSRRSCAPVRSWAFAAVENSLFRASSTRNVKVASLMAFAPCVTQQVHCNTWSKRQRPRLNQRTNQHAPMASLQAIPARPRAGLRRQRRCIVKGPCHLTKRDL
ncbi:hypothetical protein FNF07_15480 [Trinickia caryophylli]|nr:hypothetical protein FNF07_15480 [Trinickia caryophylli]